ncbi:MAG TPA: DUF4167 domain-containing protein [Amaricoccus sp.]|uniref:DUF4167 domain-containing protein n=1 Tax=Amaricoccus sp. TaxID=1872485 RepID=UPI002D0DF873|nr:DUF4167 domain-containing protein [Amaricoccus sp.]HMQ93915.1 DUF4167 domain-containing protein [Amaricoccus sp.]HMR53772.1 DUF4167 domain-containing protein [Amaricoccus sp.]HMR61111.1 DUF4167 domain-containing protein [Amaricoccus sp.]HMU00528.1 DUF4167 domain-containing protein [Amaricoccus sp.]
MRPSNKQRSRNKSGGGHSNQRRSMGNIVNRVFESAGPDGKVRGTPQQIIDKYQALARDAQVSGDRVAAESFLQHSEHYSRMLGEALRQQMEQRSAQEREEGSRGEDQRNGEARAEEGGRRIDQRLEPFEDRPRAQPAASSGSASGMATFDADDEREADGGLIETPEGRSEPQKASAPQPAAPELNGSGHPAAVAAEAPEPPAAPARRPRTRRRAKAEESEGPAPSE